MRLKKILRALFPSLVEIPSVQARGLDAKLTASLIRRYSRGNLNLFRGRFVTAEQLELRKQKLARHAF
ncbi:hypothetical protein RBE51_18360 [Pseudomonas taiwanensis]|uniref:hypothetical protein n=1 Tax=Pseudomonas taiwanensis TaxID=470150 RepID=UPI0028DFB797|nr:hypothetical protein [Pseudomonas taiwanensis]MDT8924760.1 hypothetical protein [Pseudomonas taiwanensis]